MLCYGLGDSWKETKYRVCRGSQRKRESLCVVCLFFCFNLWAEPADSSFSGLLLLHRNQNRAHSREPWHSLSSPNTFSDQTHLMLILINTSCLYTPASQAFIARPLTQCCSSTAFLVPTPTRLASCINQPNFH
ncbi:unnamed protein product [Gadus morhua 'NCC']